MKRLSDYTQNELANLTSEEYENLIDCECMIAGAPLSIDQPHYKAVPEVPEGDVEVFDISIGITVTNPAEAEAICAAIRAAKTRIALDYEYRYDSKYKYIEERDEYSKVEPKKFIAYSKDLYTSVKSVLAEIKQIKDYNDEIRSEYNERHEAREEVVEKVNNAIREAVAAETKLRDARQLYEKYLELSGGDSTVADKFFNETRYADLLSEVRGDKEGNK